MRISAVITASLLVAAALTGCQASATPSATPKPGSDCSYPVSGSPARAVDPPDGSNVAKSGTVTMTLDMAAGPVVITMDRAKAPCTVNSFESLVTQQYFDQTQCHRMVDQGIFILQCGDPSATGSGGPGYSFADELTGDETYPKGTVAMANAGPNTNGSQFFLVWEDSPLPPKYTVFGTLDEASLATVFGIASQGINPADMTAPNADASITAVTLG